MRRACWRRRKLALGGAWAWGFTVDSLTHYPILVFLLTFAMLWLGARFGSRLRGLKALSDPEDSADLTMILGATLTLLALIIGFTFSMATGRYDERKTFEEAEANAIGTEFVRADFLPPADGAKVRRLLVEIGRAHV